MTTGRINQITTSSQSTSNRRPCELPAGVTFHPSANFADPPVKTERLVSFPRLSILLGLMHSHTRPGWVRTHAYLAGRRERPWIKRIALRGYTPLAAGQRPSAQHHTVRACWTEAQPNSSHQGEATVPRQEPTVQLWLGH